MMNSPDSTQNDFLKKLTEVIEANITRPQFGVSMLAKEMGMGRHSLYLKVKSNTRTTVSQFINQVRLKKAKEILQRTSDTVSEVAYKVGYNNVSYFIKCFHEYYGYSPGQVGKREAEENQTGQVNETNNKRLIPIVSSAIILIVLAVVVIVVFKPFSFQQKRLDNTIAILHPDNWEKIDPAEINGIIYNLHYNFCKIKAVKVRPMLSTKPYSTITTKSPQRIARELKVNYLIYPKVSVNDGKKYLSLTLIEGFSDEPLYTYPYEINSNNNATVHQKMLYDILEGLNISISPKERFNINQLITLNNNALEHYWNGVKILNQFYSDTITDLQEAVNCFEEVLAYDNECAPAYAQLARTYYLMDYHWLDHSTAQHEILYGKKIKEYAEEAYRIDSLLDLSSIAKALYYMNEKDYENAIFYLQHALDYNPNSYLAIGNLYLLHTYTKNREEIIKNALKIINSGLPLENSDNELSLEGIYTWLAQSYRFLGFFKEALYYYDEAIRTNEDYLGSSIYKSQCILHSDEEDKYQKSIKILKDVIKKDPTSAYAYSRLGQSYYLIRDYSNAYRNYNKSFELKGKSATDHFGLNAGRLAVVYREMDEPEKAQILINNYREFGESRNLATRSFRLTGYYSFINDTTNTLKELRKASEYYQNYNRISQLRDEPIYDNMRELTEFQELFSKMQTRWETRRDSIRVVFEEKDYL